MSSTPISSTSNLDKDEIIKQLIEETNRLQSQLKQLMTISPIMNSSSGQVQHIKHDWLHKVSVKLMALIISKLLLQ